MVLGPVVQPKHKSEYTRNCIDSIRQGFLAQSAEGRVIANGSGFGVPMANSSSSSGRKFVETSAMRLPSIIVQAYRLSTAFA